MKKFSKSILLLCITIIFSQITYAQPAINILNNFQKRIDSTKFLHYRATYLSINPAVDNPMFQSKAEIWLQRVPFDSIFGAHFHVKGSDKLGRYEYYYDGQNGIEIRDFDSSITIFDPYKYPNDYNNPAKARTALEPFVKLIIDSNFKSSLLKGSPKILLDTKFNSWTISLSYPKEENGMVDSKKLHIDKNTFTITQIEDELLWRGIRYFIQIFLSDYSTNSMSVKNNIRLTRTYNIYKRRYINGDTNKDNPNKTRLTLIGKKAPGFLFPSYAGKNISLNQYKGKIIVLDFWESWCGYCIAVLPEMNKFQKDYLNKGVKLIGITTENKNGIKGIIKYNKLNYTNLYGDSTIIKNYDITGRPTYVLIDKSGVIKLVSTGDFDKVKEELNQLTEN
jgi:thiol-disulfide isomerase/thioredoxin